MIYKSIALGDFDFLHLSESLLGESLKSFAKSLQTMIDSAKNDLTEEFQKNLIAKFLYENFGYECNTLGKADLAIYDEGIAKVLFEVKSTENKAEFVKSPQSLESKAFYESILYFLREFHKKKNNNIKHIILCTAREFYVIKAQTYHALFIANADKAIQKAINTAYKNCDLNQGNDTSTRKFYDEIESILREMSDTIEFCYINIESLLDSIDLADLRESSYKSKLDSADSRESAHKSQQDSHKSKQNLALFYALLLPNSLLQIPRYIDANTLNERFYKELLYILGLKQVETNGKVLLKPDSTPNALLDLVQSTFADKLPSDIDEAFETHIFPLITLWNNRILFLRLLESMLLNFKHIEKPFLHIEVLSDFNALSTLFFKVLAVKEREAIPQNLANIPYLNSSLFEKGELESQGFEIAMLESKPLKIASDSILRRDSAQNAIYKAHDSLPFLEYLFAFLHAYNFTTTPKDIVDFAKINHDKLINSAVLGLVFEKLNGYKEGSFFTPSFITSYMCAQSIRKIVLQKFNENGYKAQNLTALRNEIDINKLNEANKIFLSIHICDPAVGSGHFLVSALNELIAIKHELGLLLDCDGKRLRDIDLSLENDELIIKDFSGKIIDYTIPAHERIESHIIQKALFHTKKELIENCLFGVDINPNSVEICKLRLWIELLKYSYYENIATKELQTLPNIDINIKCGNSLISNFALDSQFTKTQTKEFMQNLKITISDYKAQVALYKEALTNKRTITDKIRTLKTLLQNYLIQNSSESKRLIEFLRQFVVEYGESYFDIDTTFGLEMLRIIRQKGHEKVAFRFQPTMEQLEPKDLDKTGEDLLEKIKAEFTALETLRKGDSFEWRFEFPEVLNENGDFMGFDLVIGNPPYISTLDLTKSDRQNKDIYNKKYPNLNGLYDIYVLFILLGLNIRAKNGSFGWIVPNKFLIAEYAKQTFDMLLENKLLEKCVDVSNVNTFERASVYPIVILGNNNATFEKFYIESQDDLLANNLKQEHYIDWNRFKTFADFGIKIQSGLAGFQAHSIVKFLTTKKKKGAIPFAVSGSIDRYSIDTNKVTYMRQIYKNPYIAPNNAISINKWNFWKNEKIIIAGMTKKLESCYVKTPLAIGVGVYAIYDFARLNPLLLLGILNSKFMNYIFVNKFKDKHLAGGYLGINKNNLDTLPIFEPNAKNKKIADKVANLVDKILESKSQGKDTTPLESQIDDLVFELYNLDSKEIEIVKS